ncbi:MAG: transglutaminase [Bacteroidetes bacterium]|nr:transglutaminase [Bacteroidota bacterium]
MPESKQSETSPKTGVRNAHFWAELVVKLISRLLTIPIFIILHKALPNPDWPFYLDRILLFIALIFLVELILKLFKISIFIGFLAAVVLLTYGSLSKGYGFGELTEDYQNLVVTLWESPHPEKVVLNNMAPFPNRSKIREAADYDNAKVRGFALMAVNRHFKKYQNDSHYRTIIQCFAIFKEINSRWNYVSDPKGEEYFAKASESAKYLSGDCDDHAVLMASCVRSVGGTPRLIHTNRHLYPELLIGNKKDLEKIIPYITRKLFREESRNKSFHYHIDDNGQVWMNLDYTERYPGGKFLSPEILGVMTLE